VVCVALRHTGARALFFALIMSTTYFDSMPLGSPAATTADQIDATEAPFSPAASWSVPVVADDTQQIALAPAAEQDLAPNSYEDAERVSSPDAECFANSLLGPPAHSYAEIRTFQKTAAGRLEVRRVLTAWRMEPKAARDNYYQWLRPQIQAFQLAEKAAKDAAAAEARRLEQQRKDLLRFDALADREVVDGARFRLARAKHERRSRRERDTVHSCSVSERISPVLWAAGG